MRSIFITLIKLIPLIAQIGLITLIKLIPLIAQIELMTSIGLTTSATLIPLIQMSPNGYVNFFLLLTFSKHVSRSLP